MGIGPGGTKLHILHDSDAESHFLRHVCALVPRCNLLNKTYQFITSTFWPGG